jgi:alkylhydroperoxidase family enzyme
VSAPEGGEETADVTFRVLNRGESKYNQAPGVYCLSAHTYLARNVAKLDDAEITANRNGASNDVKADSAVRFAVKVTKLRGHVSSEDFLTVKAAGYTDAQVIEIVQHVALNTWTNYINSVAQTDIDFPVISARKVA